MAQRAVVKQFAFSIRLACDAFSISEKCYRYQAKLSSDNQQIADWLLRLTHNQRNWGFGLCYLYLRNVKGFKWNHKRIYRIYRELELNMRIKPRKRLVREQPEPLAVPYAPNEIWSMDFMHDQLADGRSIRFIQPGKPQQNAYIERYNRTVRYDWLAHHLFDSVSDIQDFATRWLRTYNHERPNMYGLGRHYTNSKNGPGRLASTFNDR